MKKFIFLTFALLSSIFILGTNQASAQVGYEYSEAVDSFHSEIEIKEDKTVVITEEIVWDFKDIPNKHGIIRHIPVSYLNENGEEYSILFKLISVKNEDGKNIRYRLSKYGVFVEIKIGSPNETVTGKQKYVIKYEVFGVIENIEGTDVYVLAWNVNGDQHTVLHKSVTANVKFSGRHENSACYTGEYLSQNQDCDLAVNENLVEFSSKGTIYPFQGMSVGVDFSNPNFAEESKFYSTVNRSKNIWMFLIPIFSAVLAFFLWFKKGRDTRRSAEIPPMFSRPKNLIPAEYGTLVDEKANLEDLTTTIIDLSVRGYLKIRQIEEKGLFKKPDFELIKTGKNFSDLTSFENKFLSDIFGKSDKKKLSKLRNKFYSKLPSLKSTLYKNLTNGGYFVENPEKARSKRASFTAIFVVSSFVTFFMTDTYRLNIPIFYLALGFTLSALLLAIFIKPKIWFLLPIIPSTVLGLSFRNTNFHPEARPFAISMALTLGVLVWLYFVMPKKTPKGVLAMEELEGVKKFLKIAEKDNYEHLKLSDDSNWKLDQLLPFAILVGMQKEWAKAFETIYDKAPEWFESTSGVSNFGISSVMNSLSSLNSVAKSSFSSTPRSTYSSSSSSRSSFSSGGGFSGGGFGGGGTSSW